MIALSPEVFSHLVAYLTARRAADIQALLAGSDANRLIALLEKEATKIDVEDEEVTLEQSE